MRPENQDEKSEKLEWDLVLEEYRSLRAEELGKMDKQYQILGLGVGGIAALLGLAIQYEVFPLFLVLPPVILSGMSLYHLERKSILNAGEYIRLLEDRIIRGNKDLGWERWLDRNPERSYVYVFVELASTSSVFFIYLLCVYGVLASPLKGDGFELINSPFFRRTLALLYLLVGGLAYLACNFGCMRLLGKLFKPGTERSPEHSVSDKTVSDKK